MARQRRFVLGKLRRIGKPARKNKPGDEHDEDAEQHAATHDIAERPRPTRQGTEPAFEVAENLGKTCHRRCL